METTTLLALLLAAAAEQPPPPLAASEAEAATEAAQWVLVARVNSAAAYEIYLRRFPAGDHVEGARAALRGLGAADAVPALPPSQRPPSPPSPGQIDRCSVLMLEGPESAEAVAYRAVRRDNRLAELRRHVTAYSQGACTANIERLLAARSARRAAIVPIPGLGPLPPHRLAREIFSNDDYPAAAIRAEQMGVAVAAWEVAEDGVPEACRIVGSSGWPTLDAATCTLIVRRMSYDPARDAGGNPVRSADRMTVRWILPDEPPAAIAK